MTMDPVLVQLEQIGGLLSATSLAEAGPYLLSAISRGFGWDLGTLWEVDRESNALRAAVVWHPPGVLRVELADATRAARLARGEELPGKVWDTGAPIWVEDVTSDTTFVRVQAAAREGFRSVLLFPVRPNGEVHGVVELFSRHAHPQNAALVQTLVELGRRIGQHLQRSRADQALQGVNDGLERRVEERTQSLRASEVREERSVRALASSEQQLRALAAHCVRIPLGGGRPGAG